MRSSRGAHLGERLLVLLEKSLTSSVGGVEDDRHLLLDVVTELVRVGRPVGHMAGAERRERRKTLNRLELGKQLGIQSYTIRQATITIRTGLGLLQVAQSISQERQGLVIPRHTIALMPTVTVRGSMALGHLVLDRSCRRYMRQYRRRYSHVRSCMRRETEEGVIWGHVTTACGLARGQIVERWHTVRHLCRNMLCT
jgi:hypothetical protein